MNFIQISRYRRAVLDDDDRKGEVISIGEVVSQIRTGSQGLGNRINTLRGYLAKGQVERYHREKKILPAATFSGVFSIRVAENKVKLADRFTAHSGAFTLDIDDIPRDSIKGIKVVLSLHPHVFLIFISPSGTGLKVFVKVDPVPSTENDREHKHVWKQVKAQLDEILSNYGLRSDKGDDPARLCFLCHDPHVYYEPDKPAFTWDREAYHRELKKQEQKQRASLESRNWDKSDVDVKALDHIPNNLPYEEWRNVGMAIKDAGLSIEVFRSWTGGQRLRSTGEWVSENIDSHWNRWNRTSGKIATWGTVVYLAQQRGYRLPSADKAREVNRPKFNSQFNSRFRSEWSKQS